MSELVFANSTPQRAQVEDLIHSFLCDAVDEQVDVSRWLLVDPALLEGDRFAAYVRRWPGEVRNALAGSSLAAFGEYSPYLLRCPSERGQLADLALQLYALAGNATAISWLRCRGTAAELGAMAAYLGKVWIQERKAAIHCRSADTRILPELLATLDSQQIAPVATRVVSWQWCARDGQPVTWNAPAFAAVERWSPSPELRLGVEQFRGLQRAAEADGIFLMLCRKTPELVPADERGLFHGLLTRLLANADALNITGTDDRLQFVVLGLGSGEDFHAMPVLQPVWQALSNGGQGLRASMQQWDERIWSELERRHAAVEEVGS